MTPLSWPDPTADPDTWLEIVVHQVVLVTEQIAALADAWAANDTVALVAAGLKVEQLVAELWGGYRMAVLPSAPATGSTPANGWSLVSPVPGEWAQPLARLVAAVDTLVQVAVVRDGPSGRVVVASPEPLLTSDVVESLAPTLIPVTAIQTLKERARTRLFTEQVFDLVGAVGASSPLGLVGRVSFQDQIANNLMHANNSKLGRWPLDRVSLEGDTVVDIDTHCLDEGEAAQRMYGTKSTAAQRLIRQQAARLEIIAIPGNDNVTTRRYPSFQFHPKGGLELNVKRVLGLVRRGYLPDGSHPLSGWPLAIWIQINQSRDMEFFERALDDVNLLDPARCTPSANQISLETIQEALNEGCLAKWRMPSGTYYRVSRKKFKQFPYSYSRHDDHQPGRYDPANSDDLGSLYLGEDAIGCWAETMDRQLVVTLSHLAQRALFQIKVSPGTTAEVPVLLDLKDQHSRLNSASRQESQGVAQLATGYGFDGIRYSLRTMPTHFGLAVFGKRPLGTGKGRLTPGDRARHPGGNNARPEKCGVKGQWSNLSHVEWYESEDLWKWLDQARSGRSPAFPVILRRLPEFSS